MRLNIKNTSSQTYTMFLQDFQIQWGEGDSDYGTCLNAVDDTMMPYAYEPVSYTHLDVYKRQALWCWAIIFSGAGFSKRLKSAAANAEAGRSTVFGYYVTDPERFGVCLLYTSRCV